MDNVHNSNFWAGNLLWVEIWGHKMSKRIWKDRYTIIIGLLLGFLVIPAMLHGVEQQIYAAYDRMFPVVSFHGEIISKLEDSVIISVVGTKNRDCTYIIGSVDAFSVVAGVLHNAHEQKMDIESGSRPVGVAKVGMWRIWPTHDADSIWMFVQHNCNGRIVQTKIVDVSLK